MATNPTSQMLQRLRRVLLQDDAGLTDGQLLGCFIDGRDEAAFAALVKRHGRLVWNVCRRLLGEQDAVDAFQAAFLVLCRKAASIRRREMLASWLYGVAHQTALQARRTAARRRVREKQVVDMPEPAVVEQDLGRDLRPLLDQELSRLPDTYQVVLLLCDLEGKTRKEAARQLGLPEGTVASRLARGRDMLAKRLARHGLAVTGGTLAAVLSQQVVSASAPPSVVSSTIKVVTLVTTGQAATTGVISGTVAALTQGAIKAMFLNKLMKLMGLLLVIGVVSGGVELMYHMQAAEPPKEQHPKDDRPQATKGKDAGKEKQPKDDRDKLQGIWRLVAIEANGVNLGDDSPGFKDLTGQRMVIDKSSITGTGKLIPSPNVKKEPEDYKAVGTFALDTKKNPKIIVITWKTNPALSKEYLTQRGIYALDGDSLKCCYYNPGSDTRHLIPKDFSSSSKRIVSFWKRVRSSEKGQEEKRPKDRLAQGGTAKKDTVKSDTERIQGTWRPVKIEVNGVESLALLFRAKEGNQLRLTAEKGTSNFFMDEKDFTFQLDPASKPKAIDLRFDKPNETLLGIYRLQGDDLTICVCIKGKQKRPLAFEDYWTAGSYTALLVLKRQKADK